MRSDVPEDLLVRAPLVRSSPFLYCIPAHTHALMRFRVHSVTVAEVAIYEGSGVTVDTETTEDLSPASGAGGETGPLRRVPQSQIDVVRTWEGAPPDEPVYYSSVETYRKLHSMALARYGMRWTPSWDEGLDLPEIDPGPAMDPPRETRITDAELERLRRRMMEAHPDHGGTNEDFEAAYAAYEAARQQRAAES
ncbi:hypothetical protein [Neotabrizicola shimadae]|uniref:Uncharacterized protein n=1 Tax=Neotabrizicola shimadae TaxID=2807096 RepID=A0A8G0ZZB3_9RHOB|nr:hypothetical protein [Neotabrizicola shimadae]QYZ71753.1 hypothetical protein JO391_09800 [Neotabrizicola shimadae]